MSHDRRGAGHLARKELAFGKKKNLQFCQLMRTATKLKLRISEHDFNPTDLDDIRSAECKSVEELCSLYQGLCSPSELDSDYLFSLGILQPTKVLPTINSAVQCFEPFIEEEIFQSEDPGYELMCAIYTVNNEEELLTIDSVKSQNDTEKKFFSALVGREPELIQYESQLAKEFEVISLSETTTSIVTQYPVLTAVSTINQLSELEHCYNACRVEPSLVKDICKSLILKKKIIPNSKRVRHSFSKCQSCEDASVSVTTHILSAHDLVIQTFHWLARQAIRLSNSHNNSRIHRISAESAFDVLLKNFANQNDLDYTEVLSWYWKTRLFPSRISNYK